MGRELSAKMYGAYSGSLQRPDHLRIKVFFVGLVFSFTVEHQLAQFVSAGGLNGSFQALVLIDKTKQTRILIILWLEWVDTYSRHM